MPDSNLNDRFANGIEPLWLPWEGHSPRVILSTACIIRRNIEGMLFPPLMGDEPEAQKSYETLHAIVKKHSELGFTLGVKPIDMSTFTKAILEFRGLAPMEFLATIDYRELFITPDDKTVLRINALNHLTVMKTTDSLALTDLASDLNGIISTIGLDVPFAHDSYFGYLCSDAELCGTGFSAHVHMNVPGIILMGYAKQMENAATEMGFTIRMNYLKEKNLYRNHVIRVDAINLPHCTPAEIAMRLNDFAKRLERHELDARAQLLSGPHINETRNIIGRAAGTIAGSWAMTSEDAAATLSTLWAGHELGIRPLPIPQKDFFKMFTSIILQEKVERNNLVDTPISMTTEERSALLKTTLGLAV